MQHMAKAEYMPGAHLDTACMFLGVSNRKLDDLGVVGQGWRQDGRDVGLIQDAIKLLVVPPNAGHPYALQSLPSRINEGSERRLVTTPEVFIGGELLSSDVQSGTAHCATCRTVRLHVCATRNTLQQAARKPATFAGRQGLEEPTRVGIGSFSPPELAQPGQEAQG